jgi:hypothetical protein
VTGVAHRGSAADAGEERAKLTAGPLFRGADRLQGHPQLPGKQRVTGASSWAASRRSASARSDAAGSIPVSPGAAGAGTAASGLRAPQPRLHSE